MEEDQPVSSSPRYYHDEYSNVGVDDEEEGNYDDANDYEGRGDNGYEGDDVYHYSNPYMHGFGDGPTHEEAEEIEQRPKEIISGLDFYNEVAEPNHIYAYRKLSTRAQRFVEETLDMCFDKLPVDLTALMDVIDGTTIIPPEDGIPEQDIFEILVQHPNLLERLIVTLFNEEDRRISPLNTKYQVLEILHAVHGTMKRHARIRMRIAIQSVKPGTWIDEIEPEEDVVKEMVRSSHRIVV